MLFTIKILIRRKPAVIKKFNSLAHSVILFRGEKFSALTPRNGVQIRIVQLTPILASGKLCLSGFLVTDKKSYCVAAKPAE